MPDLEQTPQDKAPEPGFSAAENASKFANMLGAQAEEAPPTPEALARENAVLASEMHTLMASFPPGDARRDMLAIFHELPDKFAVADALSIPGGDAHEQGVLLHQLRDRAVPAVGGPERAEVILNYPGLTQNQDFEKVRPVPEGWREVSEAANKLGPQIEIVIDTKVGRRMFEDISAGRGDWEDVLFGYLDKGQITHQKEMVAKLHSAFRKQPAMPQGYSHPNRMSTIPDARFGHLWRAFTEVHVTMGRAVADWVEHAEGVTLPAADEIPNDWEETLIDPANAERLNAVFSDQRFKPYVDTFISLYAAADEALDSEQGKSLLRDHRQQMNTRKSNSPDDQPQQMLHKLVRQAVGERIEAMERTGDGPVLPSNLEDVFTGILDFTGEEELAYDSPTKPQEVEPDPWL